MTNVWHYHSACGRKYQLHDPIDTGALCPQCHRPFVPRIKYTCNGCGNVFYSDLDYKIGDRFGCPINGEPVIVTDEKGPIIIDKKGPAKGIDSSALIKGVVAIAALVASGVALYVLVQIVGWLVGAIQTILTLIAAVIPIVIAFIINLVKLLGIIAAGVAILSLIYWLLRATATRPADSFSEIFEVTKKRDQVAYLRQELNLDPNTPDRLVWKETVTRSRDIVLKQQALIFLLIIGAIIGWVVCFLTSKTLADIRQVIQSFLQLGVVNIALFGVIFYGSKLFLRLDNVLASKTRAVKGFIFSAMFGVATVLTIVFVPPVLGESSLSGSSVVIGLTFNIVADIVISSYDMLVSLFWRTPKETMGIAFRRLWRRLRGSVT